MDCGGQQLTLFERVSPPKPARGVAYVNNLAEAPQRYGNTECAKQVCAAHGHLGCTGGSGKILVSVGMDGLGQQVGQHTSPSHIQPQALRWAGPRRSRTSALRAQRCSEVPASFLRKRGPAMTPAPALQGHVLTHILPQTPPPGPQAGLLPLK